MPGQNSINWDKILMTLKDNSQLIRGIGIISINILVKNDDFNSGPIIWSKPRYTILEPKEKIQDLLHLISSV
jgi:hypothetical protein